MSGGLADRDVLKRLATADRVLARQLRNRYKAAGRGAARKAQEAIRSAPSHHDGELRAEIADTISVSANATARTGARVVITSRGDKMPPGKERLPVLFNARKFRHPVYARPDESRREWTWRDQVGRPGWFGRTLKGEADRFAAAAREAIDEVKAYLEGRL